MFTRALRTATTAVCTAVLIAVSSGSSSAQTGALYLSGPSGMYQVSAIPTCVPLNQPFRTEEAFNGSELTAVLFEAGQPGMNPCDPTLAIRPILNHDDRAEYAPARPVAAVAFLIPR
ncbi:hypothetical protein [Streptomyces sp. SudanB182_2057]|uniref:hypothetical protein n=1 Tax=Streptomyces sp. SudanB182_2057 TaxID=3035281 RepID=UPI003F57E3A9